MAVPEDVTGTIIEDDGDDGVVVVVVVVDVSVDDVGKPAELDGVVDAGFVEADAGFGNVSANAS